MTKTLDPQLVKMLRDKLETDLMPRITGQKIRLRTAVAVNVIALVDRQIGKAEGPLTEEWDKLRTLVKDHPKALKLVDDLQAALLKYDEDIKVKVRDAEADEAAMRSAANNVIRAAVMGKLKALQEEDREQEAGEATEAEASAEPAKDEPPKE